ncbi:hypothetical protein [Novosphingobium sp.]|uniref:hypothetical protein n=1 Tax=Novosphingobium sp. TaxID=1874826 RepID=UPI002FDD7863
MSTAEQIAWADAWQAFEAVRAEQEAYDRIIWMPAYEAMELGGSKIPANVNAEMERLVDARCKADDAIIAAAAPDLAAAVWKLEYTRERWADCAEWPEAWWAHIMGDFRRLQTQDPATKQQQWQRNFAAWRLARQRVDNWSGADDAPKEVCDVEADAWRRMLDTPAPNLAALKTKLEQLLKVEHAVDATSAWDAREVRQTLADLADLIKPEPAA